MEEGAGEETPVSGPSRWELYEILGLESKEVTLDELRSKRKRLALRYHPDRNRDDESAQQKMQQVNRAFEVLSDPLKKKLYDRFGVEAVTMYENKTIGEDLWNLIFLFTRSQFTAVVGLLCLLIVTLIIAAPIMMGWRLEGSWTCSWFLVLSPVYALLTILFLVVLLAVVIGLHFREEEESESAPGTDAFLHEAQKKKLTWRQLLSAALKLSVVGSMFLFLGLLCLRLDETIQWSWWIVFFPLFFLEGLYIYLGSPYVSFETYQRRQSGEEIFVNFYCGLFYAGFVLRAFYTEILFALFTILLAFNLEYAPATADGTMVSGYMSWWWVALPLFLLALIKMILSVVENCCHDRLLRSDPAPPLYNEDGELEESDPLEAPSLIAQAAFLCCSCLCASFLVLAVFLAAGWFQATFHYSAMAMISPLIALASLMGCVCLCCVFPLYAYLIHQYNKEDEFVLSPTPEA